MTSSRGRFEQAPRGIDQLVARLARGLVDGVPSDHEPPTRVRARPGAERLDRLRVAVQHAHFARRHAERVRRYLGERRRVPLAVRRDVGRKPDVAVRVDLHRRRAGARRVAARPPGALRRERDAEPDRAPLAPLAVAPREQVVVPGDLERAVEHRLVVAVHVRRAGGGRVREPVRPG